MLKSKKLVFLIIFSTIFSWMNLSAHGKADVEELEVDNLNSWQESFDLEIRKPGKYNIMITAEDLGGNSFVEGPYNLFVDPKSDLPVCGITNPFPDMRVVGNLNIVGTCVDDDAVKYVEIMLDGDDSHKIRAEGAEFWSYYLDTTKMAEGSHTITVIGYDINGLPGNPTSVRWDLDRNLPVTEVADKTMGVLLSGNVKFHGSVSDGNGIKDFAYSLNNGVNFTPVKINRKKTSTDFDFSIDTKKYNDGPAVIWFRASDMTGSVGIYSFLFFIDNTKPDVQIVTPIEKEECSGKFTIAGFAKDTVGIVRLNWTFGNETGEFPLTPGNPYWTLDVDTIGSTDKARKFIIEAEDKAGNIVTITRNIPLNQELDRPVIELLKPVVKQNYGSDEDIYVLGHITDDDGVASVTFMIDGDEPINMNTTGDFYYNFGKASEYELGKHKVTIKAFDIDGVESQTSVTEINVIGDVPQYEEAIITTGKEVEPYVKAMEIHPEAGAVFGMPVTSGVGIKQAYYEITWGKGQKIEKGIELKNVMNYSYAIPLDAAFPKGIANITLKTTDIYDRVSEFKGLLYITNTTIVKSNLPVIVFDDSTVEADGSIYSNYEFPVTGYVLGGKPVAVEVVPESPFVKAKIVSDNIIELTPQKGAVGNSEKLKIKITTDKGKVAESREIVFKADTAIPEIKLTTKTVGSAAVQKGKFTITGSVKCKTKLAGVSYKILPIDIEMKGSVANAAKSGEIPEASTKVTVLEDGTFTLPLNAGAYAPGMYVVEIIAESAGGNKSAAAYAFSTIPEITLDENGKMPVAKAPVVCWLDSFDVYALCVYQGELESNFIVFPRSQMQEGINPLVLECNTLEGKVITGKYSASKDPSLSVVFGRINDLDYRSGMNVILDPTSKEGGKATLYIDTGATVNSVTYEITGTTDAVTPGGQNIVTGTSKLTKPAEGSTRWMADIPLVNLPARITKIKAIVKAGSLEKEVVGNINIVREVESTQIDDEEKIYTIVPKETVFNAAQKAYVLTNGSTFEYYANLRLPISAKIVSNKERQVKLNNLAVTTNGKLVTLSAKKDGYYRNIKLEITDAQGDVYESEMFNFIADSKEPELKVLTPVMHQWLGKSVLLSGTVADAQGVRTIEYSLNDGESWKELKFEVSQFRDDSLEGASSEGESVTEIEEDNPNDTTKNLGATFSEEIDISSVPDGLVKIAVRSVDSAGLVSTFKTTCFKDVTPPVVNIIEPLDIDTVNGETTILFHVQDNGKLVKAEYIGPIQIITPADPENNIPAEYKSGERTDLSIGNFITTTVGTKKCPIDEAMSFEFKDDAGNVTKLESWDFNIDSESDLPVTEIHLPGDMEVVTRDFTISGVIYDDDGDATIYYKIDDDEYMQYPVVGTSFSINIPLISLTDNEHTVTMYAVDINGVVGKEVTRTFRVSLEEPKGAVELPTIDTSVRNIITISGWASDKNGVSKVQLSLDNGNTYNDAVGTEEWSYAVDTRAIPGGTQVVFLKVTDGYGIQGLYSSLINIDNEAPELDIDLPLDDSRTRGHVFFSGYNADNVEVTELYVSIHNLDVQMHPEVRNLKIDHIIGEYLDISDMDDGFYNVQITAKDKAGNVRNVSRNIHLDKDMAPVVVDVLYPLNGEHKNGIFNIYGQANSDELDIKSLKLFIDDKYVTSTELTNSGFFAFEITPDLITEGPHTYYVSSVLSNNQEIPSIAQTITYSATGPWITIDNFTYGDFALDRPWIQGRAGYSISEEEVLLSKTKEASLDLKEAVSRKKVEKIELSFDNGKTFEELSKNEKWMYRVENSDMSEGYHFMLVRATMKNGEVAVTRSIIQIDNVSPSIRLIAPQSGGRYNQKLAVSGLSTDDVELKNVTVALRKGDKSSYEIPTFIQGLYVDFNFWGATLFDVGVGITAFDDAVKLQFQWGQFTQEQRNSVMNLLGLNLSDMRYGGDNVFGVKIIANLSTIPFSYFFGHDWEWLYASFAVGANFTRFNKTNSGVPQILSSLFAQMEFPSIKLAKAKMFSSFSLYTEGALWFIPTDVVVSTDEDTEKVQNLVPQISVGLRVNIF